MTVSFIADITHAPPAYWVTASSSGPRNRRPVVANSSGWPGGQEPVHRLLARAALDPVLHQRAVDVLRALLGAADEGDAVAHHQRDRAGEQRVVGAPEDQGVDAGLGEGVEVVVGDGLELRPTGDPLLDELDEAGAGLRGQGDVRRGREGVLVGERLGRGAGADDPDATAVGGGHGAAGRGQDHLDHGYVVPLPGVTQHRGAGGVAGDDQGLDALVDEVVEALEGVLADLADRLGPVGLTCGVAEVDHRLVRQLVHDGPGDGQTAEARVEDPDRRVSHKAQG